MVEESDAEPSKYIEGYLFKKEEKWVKYWIVLRECHLMIHERKPDNNENIRDLLIGWIEISDETKCIMGQKKSYSFPFYIKTMKGKYLFKTPSTLLRHQWVKAIELCAQGRSPQLIPKNLSEVNRYLENSCKGNSNVCFGEENLSLDESDDFYDDPTYNDAAVEGSDKLVNPSEDNNNSVIEDFDFVNEEAASNLILVSSGCENTTNFTHNSKQNLSHNIETVENKSTGKVGFLRYEKPVQGANIPLFTLRSKPTSMDRLTKSAESLKQLKLLDSLRTNSDSSVRQQHNKNLDCKYFSRHLNKSPESDTDTLSLL